MKTQSNTDAQRTMQDEAIYWHVLLSSGRATQSDWMAFTRWLEENPERNEAYDFVVSSWEAVSEQEVFAPAPTTNDFGVAYFQTLLHKFSGLMNTRPWALAGGFAAAAMIMVMLAPTIFNQPATYTPEIYATNVGEQRSITLADGSTVVLNTDTKIAVNITQHARSIELQQGQAFFTVQHENNRVFEVMANGLRITDIGTSFDVKAVDTQTQVSVIDGIVEVKPKAADEQASPVRLIAGQQAMHSANDNIKVQPFDLNQATAWQRGNLVFKDDKLSMVVTEINRYFKKPLRLADDDLAEVLFSGVIQMSDQNRTVHDLAALLSLRVIATDDEFILTQNPIEPNQ